jgi:hypothetical protein
VQLPEDAREVTLDRAVRDKEHLCDLPVGEILARELGDATLARCQRVKSRQDDPARTRAGGSELRLGALGKPCGARAVGSVEGLSKDLSRLGAPIAPPQHGTEVGEGARALQSRVALVECLDGFSQQELALFTADHDAPGALRYTDDARGTECSGELELLFRKTPSLLGCPSARRASAASDRHGT